MAEAPTGPGIARSDGVMVGGYNPGGGRSGKYPELDALFIEAAQRLRDRYGDGIVIRVNSDRMSGGASLPGNATVGISIQTILLSRIGKLVEENGEDLGGECRRLGVDPDGPEAQFVLRVFVDETKLKDPKRANCGGRTPYLYEGAADLGDAMARLEDAYAG